MERKKYYILSILTGFLMYQAQASYKTEIYQAYISNNMNVWKTLIDKMELEKDSKNDFILELVNYQYGYIGYCIGMDKNDEAENYLDLATNNIEILEKNDFKLSEVNAYKSAFYGFRIGLALYKAPFLGPKSVKFANLSIEQNSQNPLGYIQYANGQFHMPPVFGGSKKVAIEYYQKAEKIMEQDSENIKNNWNYLSLLTQIAQSYTKIEDYNSAKKYLDKTLKIEPGFLWVKNELYPELMKEMEKNDE